MDVPEIRKIRKTLRRLLGQERGFVALKHQRDEMIRFCVQLLLQILPARGIEGCAPHPKL